MCHVEVEKGAQHDFNYQLTTLLKNHISLLIHKKLYIRVIFYFFLLHLRMCHVEVEHVTILTIN